MIIYIFCIFSIFTVAQILKILKYNTQRGKIIILCLSFVEMFAIASLRDYKVGADTLNYVEAYKTICNLPWSELFTVDFEPGYIVYNKLLGLITPNPRILFVVSGAFISFAICKFVYRYSCDVALSMIIFICMTFFFHSLNILRQFLAISIALSGIKYIEHNQFFKYLIIVVFATSFHYTAFIMLVLYPLSKFNLSFLNALIILFICGIISKILGRSLLQNILVLYYQQYSLNTSFEGGLNMMLFLIVITFSCFLVLYKKNDKRTKLFKAMMLLACCLQVFALDFSLFARVVNYMSIGMLIFIPNVLGEIKNPHINLAAKAICYIIIIFYFLKIGLIDNLDCAVPYMFL